MIRAVQLSLQTKEDVLGGRYRCECLQPLGWKMFVRRLYYIRITDMRLACADSNVHVHVHAVIDNAGY